MPGAVGSALRRELSQARALGLLLTGRRDVAADEQPLRYAGPLVPMLSVLTVVDGIVALLLHALLPAWLQVPALVLGALGVLWLLGFLASLVCYPHVVSAQRLRLRFGAFHDVVVPREAVRGVALSRGEPRTQRSAERFEDELEMVVAGQADVVVDLVPVQPGGFGSVAQDGPLSRIRFHADDARAAVRLLKPAAHQGEG